MTAPAITARGPITAGTRTTIPRRRLVLLGLGGISLLAGLNAGLLLAGLPAPIRLERLEAVHGPLMLLGFLGTLIALERAIALRTRWALLAPGLLGGGGLLLISPLPESAGHAAQTLGAAALFGVYAALWRRGGSEALLIQWLGSVLAVSSALLWWAGIPTGAILPCIAGFLVLTIAGERLELARVGGPDPGAVRQFAIATTLAVPLAGAALLWPTPGTELFAGTLLVIAAWLARHDVAVRLVRGTGLPRYVAVNILAGIAWLAVCGLTLLLLGPQHDGPGYDLAIHAVGLGFAMSMVLAHAPIILPAVLLRPLPYRPVLYAATVLLQGSLLLRAAADVRELGWAWQAGSALNVVAVLAFLLISVTLVVRR